MINTPTHTTQAQAEVALVYAFHHAAPGDKVLILRLEAGKRLVAHVTKRKVKIGVLYPEVAGNPKSGGFCVKESYWKWDCSHRPYIKRLAKELYTVWYIGNSPAHQPPPTLKA